jgi:hypothetical protein
VEPSVFIGFPELLYSIGVAFVDDSQSISLVSEIIKLDCRGCFAVCLGS